MRGSALGEPVRERLTPYERALEAWTRHLDAEEEDEYHRTRVATLQASRAWCCSECTELAKLRAQVASLEAQLRKARPRPGRS